MELKMRENITKTANNLVQPALTRLLYIDSRANSHFHHEMGASVDFCALKKRFELDGNEDKLIATYVLQQKDNVDNEKYEGYATFLENSLGWKVDRCITGLQTSMNYGYQIESMQTCLNVLDTLEDEGVRMGSNGDYVNVEVILCADHSSYLTLINKIRQAHSYAKITLIHTDRADKKLVAAVDEAIHVSTLDIARDF